MMAGIFEREIYTEIRIDTPAAKVWEVLTDFIAYPEWNPFIRQAHGDIVEGERLELHFRAGGSRSVIVRPTVLKAQINRELRWLGHLLLPRLFDGEHIFRIEPLSERSVTLIQREIFTGFLVPIFWRDLNTRTRKNLEKLNRALKTRAEK